MSDEARQIAAPLAGLLLLVFAGTSALPGPAFAQTDVVLSEARYDIPAQPLKAALARFAQISHVDIIYDDSLAEGRRSAPVSGSLTPQQALARLLEGTGLSSRFTRSSAALIYAPRAGPSIGYRPDNADPVLTLGTLHVRSTPLVGSPPRASFDAYGYRVLTAVDRLLRPAAVEEGRTYRAVMRLWIDSDGVVQRADLAQGSGDMRADRRMVERVAGLRFDPPPEQMPQPLRLQLEAR